MYKEKAPLSKDVFFSGGWTCFSYVELKKKKNRKRKKEPTTLLLIS